MLNNYNPKFLKFDIRAGLAIAALSLPTGIAYSEMLGLPPESGIYTAVFSLLCYFLLGTSKEMIIAPDSAIAALLASSIFALNISDGNFRIQFIVITTITTGILFFAGGILKLGFIANFLSRPILVGYLNGVAVILVISQIQKFTGVVIENSSSIAGLFEFLGNIREIHIPTLFTGIVSFFMISVLSLISKKIPAQILLMIISAAVVALFQIQNFGIKLSPEIQSSLPVPVVPDFSILKTHYSTILIDASAILFLSYTNTILIAKSFSKDKYAVNPDKEFFAMGLADTVCGIFKGFPVCGSGMRTTVSLDAGAKSKLAMIFAAGSMILVVLFFSKQFSLIPAVIFAAIIIDSAKRIFNFRELKEIRNFDRGEFKISMICMIGVIAIGVLDGILIALVLSFINLIRRSSHPPEHEFVVDPATGDAAVLSSKNTSLIKPGILFYRFNSPMLFYNSEYFRKKLFGRISEKENLEVIIIDASPVNYLDITFRNDLSDMITEMYKNNISLHFCNASEGFQKKLKQKLNNNQYTGLFFRDYNEALDFFYKAKEKRIMTDENLTGL